MTKKEKPAPAFDFAGMSLEDLEKLRIEQDGIARARIARFFDTKPLSLPRRAAAKALAQAEASLYAISLELEKRDPDWKRANLAACLRNGARVWYPLHDLSIPEWAQDEVQKVTQGVSLWEVA